jgi:hypothetical protein
VHPPRADAARHICEHVDVCSPFLLQHIGHSRQIWPGRTWMEHVITSNSNHKPGCEQAGRDRAFCKANYMSPGTLMMISGMRSQLLSELSRRGLISDLASFSSAAREAALVRCVLVGRLPPSQVAFHIWAQDMWQSILRECCLLRIRFWRDDN